MWTLNLISNFFRNSPSLRFSEPINMKSCVFGLNQVSILYWGHAISKWSFLTYSKILRNCQSWTIFRPNQHKIIVFLVKIKFWVHIEIIGYVLSLVNSFTHQMTLEIGYDNYTVSRSKFLFAMDIQWLLRFVPNVMNRDQSHSWLYFWTKTAK